MQGETVIEITFVVEGNDISTRIPRPIAITWLRSQGWTSVVVANVRTDLDQMDDAELAKSLAVCALLSARKTGYITVVDDDKTDSFVVIPVDKIVAIRSIPDFDIEGTTGRILTVPDGLVN